MMNSTTKKMAAAAGAAVGAKTARACDYCVRKRARWYCAADDAFLCQVCDGSVHSANPLARRHERVRLKTASSSLKRGTNSSSDESSSCSIIPSWHRGLKKKPRTPRHGKHPQLHNQRRSHPPIVPELGSEDNSTSHEEDNEDQLLYRVPTFDPFVVELFSSPTTTITSNHHLTGAAAAATNTTTNKYNTGIEQSESKSIQSILLNDDVHGVDSSSPCDDFLPSDLDLAEFAADVETLLGKGLEEESFGIEELGLLDCHDKNQNNNNSNMDMNYCSTSGSGVETITDCGSTAVIKTEEEDDRRGEEMILTTTGCHHLDTDEIDMLRDPFELTFDYEEDYPVTTFYEDGKVTGAEMMITRREDGARAVEVKDEGGYNNNNNNKEWKISLKLDYDAISTAWASHGSSPWMTGEKPQINPDDCWLHSLGSISTCGSESRLLYREMAIGTGGQAHREDGGREARVSRYREKRRTRLFSKKIRYEVRKLNAEKRPRMKGRFVKQSSFASHPIPMFTK